MTEHHSDIELGQPYRDTATGFVGTATSVHFYQYGVERVTLSKLDQNGAVSEGTFDAPRCEPSARQVTSTNGVGFISSSS